MVKLLRRAAPRGQTSIFGSEVHRFCLHPVLTEAAAAEFESKYSVRLPADFRCFITEVGNGGAGPYIGILPLETVGDGFRLRMWEAQDALIGPLHEPFPFDVAWNYLAEMPPDELLAKDEVEYHHRMEAFESSYWSASLVPGAIPICHQGCGIRTLLVVAGRQYGMLWEDRRSEYAGLCPVQLRDGTHARFAAWYAEWLEDCVGARTPDRTRR
jgi:hypothetical protein